jgi:hypothetical protein
VLPYRAAIRVATKLTQFGHELISPVTGLLGTLGFRPGPTSRTGETL